MALIRYLILALLLLLNLAASSFASDANLQAMIDAENSKCNSGADTMACIRVRAMRFVDTITNKDSYKLADLQVQANSYEATSSARSASDIFDSIEHYLQGHDVTLDLPLSDSKVTVSSRNLNNDELNLKFKLASDDVVEGKGKKGNIFKKGKKHRLRKLAMPIMVLILLKAITLIPMAIGILKIKALNALGLGFFSFIVSVGLAIFQLCKKIATEHHSAHITAHGPWDGRSVNSIIYDEPKPQLEKSAQNLAYRAYV